MDTIEGMRTFVAVATKGSFTEGARHLGISTALASKYVGQLEERLGVRLLARTTRSLSITEVGRAYLTRSQQMLDDFDALEAAIQHRQAEPSGRLILAAPVTLGESVLADAIASFLSVVWLEALSWSVIILAILTNLTVLQRVIYFHNAAKQKEK